jgi:hypothetical protein
MLKLDPISDDLAASYRLSALDCLLNAETFADEIDKDHWRKIADLWLDLAHQTEHPSIVTGPKTGRHPLR